MQKNPLEAFLDLNQSITYIFPAFKKIDIPKLLKKDFYFFAFLKVVGLSKLYSNR